MARTIFRANEVEYVNGRVILESPFPEEKPEQIAKAESALEEYIGPTADELRREAEKFKAEFVKEKAEMETAARFQAEAILDDARSRAKQIAEDAAAAAQNRAAAAETEAAKRQADAEAAYAAKIADAERAAESARKQAYDEGLDKGREDGFAQGMTEVQRLVTRTQVVLERLQEKRAAIITDTEQQLIDLTLLIARKVVKSISESHKETVIENIREALAKVKTKGKALVKVNLADLALASARIETFIKMMEGQGTIQILEDSTVEAGGCVIETDFGEIDARIANQFAELEAKIKELSSVKIR